MYGVSVEVPTSAIADLVGSLERLAAFRPQEMMEDIGEEVLAQTRERFRRQVSPDGEPWKASARAEREGGKTLILSSRLLRSINYRASGDTVVVGTNTAYAAAHQDPQVNPATGRLKRPRRAFLGLNDADAAELREIALDHMSRGLR